MWHAHFIQTSPREVGVEVAFASQSHKDAKFFPHLEGFWVRGKQNNPI
jgi:hypothetical protein